MDFIKKGTKAAKKLKDKGASAGESIVDAAKNPFELKELDEIVANLLEDCDNAIEKHTEPLQKEQADDVERALFERLNNKYDEKAKKKLDRECEDEHDNIAVRKRILNRGLDARAGKIYSKFSTDVTALNEQAAATMIRAVQSMRDAEATITGNLPMLTATINSELDALNASITDQVNASFPGGIVGIDSYDDHMPEGVSSWIQFSQQLQGIREALVAANAAAIEATNASVQQAVLNEYLNEVLSATRAVTTSNSEHVDGLQLGYLDDDISENIRNALKSKIDAIQADMAALMERSR